ncbi:MAG TPA: glyceraldehyde 3-phosphate dehydrogenase NAD-binding domain-containing protein [Acidimicrobiia bacterium]|nr:glyceraldehyde 3-phosphate dehydrogenase NAD-binding domain-containing protein [Acidimicrobiia bacterium]
MSEVIRIGLNGFGRIGRCLARIAGERPGYEIVAVNDLSDRDNLVYLYNYDSTYGRPDPKAESNGDRGITLQGNPVAFHSDDSIADVPWEDYEVDVLVDATGVHDNVLGARKVIDSQRVAKAIVTHSPPDEVDRYVIMGVNDHEYDPSADHLISSTICDANAIAHVLMALDDEFGLAGGLVTTLHPWLSYQNLVDGPVAWQRFPGAYWSEYALGRSSVMNMIAKDTTAVTALKPILPELEKKIAAISFRTPTSIVSIADLSLQLERPTDIEHVTAMLETRFGDSDYVHLNDEPRVSIDYAGEPYSAVIDLNWVRMSGEHLLKMVLWYDNEWGYSSRVLDLARLVVAD